MTNDQPNLRPKADLSAEISRQIDEYLAGGGTIDRLEIRIGDVAPKRWNGAIEAAPVEPQAKGRKAHPNAWTDEENALLYWLRSGNIPYAEIGPLLTRIPRSVSAMRYQYALLRAEHQIDD